MADEQDSDSCAGYRVWVQVPSPAPKIGKHHTMLADFYFFTLTLTF